MSQEGQHSAKYFMKNSGWLATQSYIFVQKLNLGDLFVFVRFYNSLSSIKIECVQPPTMQPQIIIQIFYILMCIWILRLGQAFCHSFFSLFVTSVAQVQFLEVSRNHHLQSNAAVRHVQRMQFHSGLSSGSSLSSPCCIPLNCPFFLLKVTDSNNLDSDCIAT